MPARSPEARARLDALRKRIYEDRKVRQVCVHCEAELGPDDGVQCAACIDYTAPKAAAWRASPKGKATRRRAQESYIMRRYNAGLCVLCLLPRDQWEPPSELAIKRAAALGKTDPPRNCPACAREHAQYQKHRNELKRQGVTDIADMRRRKSAADKVARGIKARAEVKNYVPIDELEANTKIRLLRALVRLDWPTASELFGVLEVAEVKTDRDRYAAALSRMSRGRFGQIERRLAFRDGVDKYEYRITESGRAELERVLGKAKPC